MQQFRVAAAGYHLEVAAVHGRHVARPRLTHAIDQVLADLLVARSVGEHAFPCIADRESRRRQMCPAAQHLVTDHRQPRHRVDIERDSEPCCEAVGELVFGPFRAVRPEEVRRRAVAGDDA